jgi:hypothetical protein
MAARVWVRVRIPTYRCEGGEEKRISPLRCSQETRAAPVEMTIPSSGEREQTTAKATAWGWVTIDIPPIAECAMDGAPGRFCLVEEGNNRSPSATTSPSRMTTREARAEAIEMQGFRLFGFGFNFRTAVDEGAVCSLFQRSASSVAGFDPYDVEGDFVGHAGVGSGARSQSQGVV